MLDYGGVSGQYGVCDNSRSIKDTAEVGSSHRKSSVNEWSRVGIESVCALGEICSFGPSGPERCMWGCSLSTRT